MKALIKKYPQNGIWLDDVPMPEVGLNDVLIKVLKTSICGTDIHIYDWNNWASKTIHTPMVIGHEFVGTIQQIGANVQGFKPGNLVSGEGHIVCGTCRNCLAGRRHLCKSTQGVGVNRSGAFAEYLSIPSSNVWLCDENIPLDVISCFDPLGNAVHSALSFDLLGEDVLITGAGPIGMMAVAVAKQAGARNVVITDINPYRLELAKKLNPTMTVNAKEKNLKDVIKELGMKEGFDVGLEMSGSQIAFQDMINNMFHGGKIALLGIHQPNTSIDWDKVAFNMLTIKGIYGREMYETWYKMSVMLKTGMDITPVITHRFHYTDYQKGFDVMLSGKSGKVILDWE